MNNVIFNARVDTFAGVLKDDSKFVALDIYDKDYDDRYIIPIPAEEIDDFCENLKNLAEKIKED